MRFWFRRNGREIMGWIAIVYLAARLIEFGYFRYAEGSRINETATFQASAILVVVILAWLWLNRKKD